MHLYDGPGGVIDEDVGPHIRCSEKWLKQRSRSWPKSTYDWMMSLKVMIYCPTEYFFPDTPCTRRLLGIETEPAAEQPEAPPQPRHYFTTAATFL